jgi:hypothetical protein
MLYAHYVVQLDRTLPTSEPEVDDHTSWCQDETKGPDLSVIEGLEKFSVQCTVPQLSSIRCCQWNRKRAALSPWFRPSLAWARVGA